MAFMIREIQASPGTITCPLVQCLEQNRHTGHDWSVLDEGRED